MSDQEQIKALIAEIDATLDKPTNLLGRLSGEGAKHRTTLRHLRSYLQNLQTGLNRDSLNQQKEAGTAALQFGEATLVGSGTAGSEFTDGGSLDSGTQATVQADVADADVADIVYGETVYDDLALAALPLEIGSATAGEQANGMGLTHEESIALIQQLGRDLDQLRAGLMAPLQAEVNQLQHQRQRLAQTVQQLQQQRSDAQSEQALQQSLQALMARLQQHLVAEVTAQVAEALQGIQADSVNWVADQMEAQPAMPWQEQSTTARTLSISGESPMGRPGPPIYQQFNSGGHNGNSDDNSDGNSDGSSDDPSQASTREADPRYSSSPIALEGPELTLDSLDGNSFSAVPDESTSSAGIARRRILAAQSSEFQAQQSLEQDSRRQAGRPANSLEDFYVSLGASTAAQATQAAQQRAMAVQHRAQQSQPGVVQGHYQNLEDALFDGIPEGDNPWAQSANQASNLIATPIAATPTARSPRLPSLPSSAQLREMAYPPAEHRIQRLTDLVDQRFDDFGTAAAPAQAMPETLAAFYGDRPISNHHSGEKKKPFRRGQLRKSA